MKGISLFIMSLFFVAGVSAQNVWINNLESNVANLDAETLEQKLMANIADEQCYCYIDIVVNEGRKERMQNLENLSVVTADLDVTLYNALDGNVVSTKYIVLSGSGNSEKAAYRALLSSVRKKSQTLRTAIKESASEIGVPDCAQIKSASELMISENRFDAAFTLSRALTTQCGDAYSDFRRKIYNAYQEDNCQRHLSKVKTDIAARNFNSARNEIIKIAPDSSCSAELSDLIDQLKEATDLEQNRAFEIYIQLSQQRIQSQANTEKLIELLLLNKIVNE